MAAVCLGQDFTPPPGPSTDGLVPSFLTPQEHQPNSGVPIVEPVYGPPPYMLLRTVHVKAQYRFTHWLSAFAAYDWSNESYMLLDSPDVNDRFFMYDQRASLGLQTSFLQHFTASVSGGYIFDRFMFEGTSSTATSADRVYLGNGPFAALNLGVRY